MISTAGGVRNERGGDTGEVDWDHAFEQVLIGRLPITCDVGSERYIAGVVLVEGPVHVRKGRLLANWRCTRGGVEAPRLEAMQHEILTSILDTVFLPSIYPQSAVG